ncbi:uncharacterized protein BROUX77_004801 [Berkeleyomyces rouxiae]|uniref:uncharacterized protein n=1 Tax=Berkeleyomyces rouxiae TaxID=2035830 RepID=UPI003B7A66D8
MLAIHSCLRAWRSYLAGIPFEVHTDHQNLLYFQKQRTLSERQRRWAHELSEFDFRLIHRPGVTQVTSDALSRRDQDLPQDLSDKRLQSRVHQVLRPDGPDFVIAAAVWAKEPDKDPEVAVVQWYSTWQGFSVGYREVVGSIPTSDANFLRAVNLNWGTWG